MLLLRLFWVFLRIGFFAVGGAYSFLPLLEKDIVQKYSWLSKEEFLEVLSMVKIFPGAISVKYATYVGLKTAGFWGAVAANAGNLLAPVGIIVFASYFYSKYKNLPRLAGAFNTVQLVVFAMIIAVAFQTISVDKLIIPKNIIVIVISFFLFIYTNIHPALIIICGWFFGLAGK